MLENFVHFNLLDIKAIFSDKNLYNFSEDWISKGISIDSRSIKPGNIFIAINGENSNGHYFVQDAINKGSSAVVIQNEWAENNFQIIKNHQYIITDDTIKSLGLFANYHRRRYDLPIIAIGGSNGKTTTKEMTAHLLSQKFKVLKTYKNFNNQLGLPLMLLQLDESYEIAVFELGTNEPGEMAILTKISEPNFGLLTNIGKEHLEKLIDLDGVEFEETLLYGWLHRTGGTIFINMEDERLKKYYNILENRFSYSISYETDLIGDIKLDTQLKPTLELKYQDRIISAKLNTNGYVSGLNAIAASAIGFYFGLNNEELKNGLESFFPELWNGYGRMFVENISNFKVINDCYNANPSSMKMGLEAIKNFNFEGEKIAVLGDMRELGDSSFEEHKILLNIAVNSVNKVLLIGNETKRALSEINRHNDILHFDTHKDISEYLLNIKENALLLIKGSRGLEMEKILNYLR